MKITLIQPKYFNIWEAIGLGYIGSNCGNHDINFYQAYFDNDIDIINGSLNSDIIGISCTSPTYQHGIFLAKEIKKRNPNIRIIFGGNHVTAIQQIEYPIDQIVIGEGEYAFNDIVNNNNKNHKVTGKYLDFDQINPPDRRLIKNERTLDLCEKMTGRRIGSFQANRGCVFSCKYCAEKSMSKHNIRHRNIENILDEIEMVRKDYNIDMFKFVDAMFDLSADYVKEFCVEKIRRGNKLEWECMLHATFTDEEMFKLMAQANCIQVDIGCESGSPKILKQMKKGVTINKIKESFNFAKKFNIKRRAFFIIGMPEETEEDLLLTENFIDELKPDSYGVTIICPYPGSDFYNKNFKDINWSRTDEYSNNFWKNTLTNEQLKTWQKRLTNKPNSLHKDRM